MNLIACSKPCRYQRDGYCQLEQPLPLPIEEKDQECCYYQSPEGTPSPLPYKKGYPFC